MDDLERSAVLEWAEREAATCQAHCDAGTALTLSPRSCGEQAGWFRRLLTLIRPREHGVRLMHGPDCSECRQVGRVLTGTEPGLSQKDALLIQNQATEIGRLKNFVYETYDEDCGLAVWEPGYAGGKYADIAADAKRVHEAELEEMN